MNIIYRIRAIMTNRLAPYMNLLTPETQTAYKTGMPTIGIFPIIQNQLRNERTAQLILIGPSGEFRSINRDVMWAVLFENATP